MTAAITKNGVQKLAAPPPPDLSKFKTDKKITDEEVLQILEQPLAKETKAKNKKKKKKSAKKASAGGDDDDESSGDE
jgi:topoisomerase IA-like protein